MLRHGNVFRALQLVEDLEFDVDGLTESPALRTLAKAVHAFASYVRVNRAFISNYGDRYRYGEAISTAFVESTVNQVIRYPLAGEAHGEATADALDAAGRPQPAADPEPRLGRGVS